MSIDRDRSHPTTDRHIVVDTEACRGRLEMQRPTRGPNRDAMSDQYFASAPVVS